MGDGKIKGNKSLSPQEMTMGVWLIPANWVLQVYDRVRLADQLLQFFGPNADPSTESFRVWSVRQENLLPVLPNAQQQVTPYFDSPQRC